MNGRIELLHWPLWIAIAAMVFGNVALGDSAVRVTAILLFLVPLTLFTYLLMSALFWPKAGTGASGPIEKDRAA